MQEEFWKVYGFAAKEEYNAFMMQKIEELFTIIKNDPELVAVFKRLANT
jgi:hypothetical protein